MCRTSHVWEREHWPSPHTVSHGESLFPQPMATDHSRTLPGARKVAPHVGRALIFTCPDDVAGGHKRDTFVPTSWPSCPASFSALVNSRRRWACGPQTLFHFSLFSLALDDVEVTPCVHLSLSSLTFCCRLSSFRLILFTFCLPLFLFSFSRVSLVFSLLPHQKKGKPSPPSRHHHHREKCPPKSLSPPRRPSTPRRLPRLRRGSRRTASR